MIAERSTPMLRDRLPKIRGTYEPGADLSKLTWLRVGGPAEVLFRPKDHRDLARFLEFTPGDIPLTVIGIGSNLLIRDGGIAGVVIRLGEAFAEISVSGDLIIAGTAAAGLKIANASRDAGLAGLEFLSGIPGSLGGALVMNAGAFGGEIKDVLVSAEALDRSGTTRRVNTARMGFSYRHSAPPGDYIFTGASLRGEPAGRERIIQRLAEIQEIRAATQPRHAASGGSTFINPPGAKAWRLIEQAGCRDLIRGGARVSEKHANFLINTGNATAADLEGLGEEIRRRVMEKTGVRLEWEIKRLGLPAGPAAREIGI